MLIKMGIKYGSEEAIEVCDKIGHFMAKTAITESVCYGHVEEKSFPACDFAAIEASEFYQNHVDKEELEDILYEKPRYIMNSQLLTIAPTGSISTMLGVSGGIEPIYANSYQRKTETLHGHDEYYTVYTPIVAKYMEEHGLTSEDQLPDYFVTAKNIDYKDRIQMQSIWQQHIDASISSTVNVPNDFTVEDVEDLYIQAWRARLKGVTLFRDGCKRTGILTESSDSGNDDKNTECEFVKNLSFDLPRGVIIKADDNCVGKKRTLHTGCGSLHCSAFFDPDTGDLLETYFSKGSSGGCNNFMIGLSRMISLAARGGIDIYSIVDQLKSSGVCPSYATRTATKHDTSKGSSCPVAIGYALMDMYEEFQDDIAEDIVDHEDDKTVFIRALVKQVMNPCPQCGEELIFEGGCNICKSCGYTKCD